MLKIYESSDKSRQTPDTKMVENFICHNPRCVSSRDQIKYIRCKDSFFRVEKIINN